MSSHTWVSRLRVSLPSTAALTWLWWLRWARRVVATSAKGSASTRVLQNEVPAIAGVSWLGIEAVLKSAAIARITGLRVILYGERLVPRVAIVSGLDRLWWTRAVR